MQRSQYIRIDCGRRLLCGHMLVRKDEMQRVMYRLHHLGVRFKATITPGLIIDK